LSRLPGIPELLDYVFARLERENGGTAIAMLAALALAPDGLPESLLPILSGDVGTPLPPLRTLLLRQAIEGIAVAQGNLVTLRSSLVREAILRRIAESDRAEFQRGMVQKLSQALDVAGAPEEILRQLLVLRDWEAIGRLLLDPAVFDGLARRAPQQLRLYWARLSEARPEQRVSAYRTWSTDAPQQRRADAAELAENFGDSETAQLLAGWVCTEPADDAAACVRARLVLARLAESKSDFDAAGEHLAAVEAEPLRSAIPRATAFAAWHRASIALRRFGPDAAEKQMETRAPPGGGNDPGIAEYLLDMRAEIALERGKIKAAVAYYGELLAVGERLGDLTFIAAAEAGLAKAALRRGRRREAGQHAQHALRFARICGDANVLQDALGTAARHRLEADKLDDARRLIDERLELTTRTGNRIGQLEAKIDSARLHALCQLPREAQRLFDEVTAIAARDGLSFLARKLEADAAGRNKSDHM
jgi:tetratricopeptide (TPR) repeat protein